MKYLYIFVFTFLTHTAFAQFSLPVIIDSTNQGFGTHILIVDLDNDNQNDIVVGYTFDSLRWYKNNNLNFVRMPLIGSGMKDIMHIDIADVDGNGFKDIVVSEKSNSSKVHLIKNLGNGTSWSASLIDNNVTLSVARSYFVDMDNDSDLDIISCLDPGISIYYNNGAGVFSGRNLVAGQGNINEFYNLVVKDYNGDGLKDFITHTALGTEYYKANNNNTYVKQSLNNTIFSFLETADIDNDGDFDIFYPNNSNSTFVETFKNNGLGTFALFQSISFTAGGQLNPPLKFMKVNLDTYIDAIYRNLNFKGMFYRENDGAGNFLAAKLVDSLFTYTMMNTGDLDNDNKNDIIWYAGSSTKRYLGYTKNVMTVTAVTNISNSSANLKIFPNPVADKMFITHTYSSNKHKVQVINCLGKIIFQLESIPSQIDVTKWINGIYFLKVEGMVYKIVKA
jgi:hypothetical protein